jgi:hypothetical protein
MVKPIVIVFLLLAEWNVYICFGPAGFAVTAWERLLITIFTVAFQALDATPHKEV